VSALLHIPWFKLEGLVIPGTHVGLQPFGMLVAAGVFAGMRLAEWHAVKLGMRRDVITDCAIHVVIIGFILGHIFDLVFYYPEKLREDPLELFLVWKGLSSYGGFFGAVAGGFFWSHRRGLPLFPALDQIAFGLPLGWFFGRLGCFVVHDHPGKVSTFFLAVNDYQYPGLPVAPRHDLGLYEVLWALLVVPLFLWLDRKPRPFGFWLGLIAVLYAPVRYGLDFLRVADKTYDGLTAAHYASILTLLLGLSCFWRAYRRPVTSLPPDMLALDRPPGT